MIDVKFRKRQDKLISFYIKGHAESVDEGYDLVCCAVSSISITIANGIVEVAKANASVKMEDGFLSLYLDDVAYEKLCECQVLMETMLLGLESIEKEYDEYINVKVEEV